MTDDNSPHAGPYTIAEGSLNDRVLWSNSEPVACVFGTRYNLGRGLATARLLAAAPDLLAALQAAGGFIEGFRDDDCQDVSGLLILINGAIAKVKAGFDE